MGVSPPSPAASATARAACVAWLGPKPPEFGPRLGGGFSGAPPLLVRPRGSADWLVLKRFPFGTDRHRAAWVHSLVRHLGALGVTEVPQPRETRAGSTLASDPDGGHWELTPLVTGVSIAEPSAAQAAAALAALARLHAAATTMPGAPPRVGPSPGVMRRIEQARHLVARPWRDRRAAIVVDEPFTAAVADRWDRAIALFAANAGSRAVASVSAWPTPMVPLQVVLRDVWSAHVLFADRGAAQVAGIVDAHAAGIDTPATDLARLLGSWRDGRAPSADPVESREDALAAYAAVRPDAVVDRRLVCFLHTAGILCGLDNWFRWACEERRTFAAPALARIDRLLDELPAALEWLARRLDDRV